MSKSLDLRSYNINDVQSAMDFVDLVTAKLPQVHRVLRNHAAEVASLQSHLDDAVGKKAIAEAAAADLSIGSRLSGAKNMIGQPLSEPDGPLPVGETDRLEQLRAARGLDTPEVEANPAPGEIGALNLSGDDAGMTEEEIAAQAGTSPSEHASDNEVQQENKDTKIPQNDPLEEDDITGVGDRAARAAEQNLKG